MATYLKDKVKDLSAVHHHFDAYDGLSEDQARERSLKANLDLMAQVWDRVAGFNVMSGGGPSLAIELALEFSKLRAGRRR
jgi:hypothetical protein